MAPELADKSPRAWFAMLRSGDLEASRVEGHGDDALPTHEEQRGRARLGRVESPGIVASPVVRHLVCRPTEVHSKGCGYGSNPVRRIRP